MNTEIENLKKAIKILAKGVNKNLSFNDISTLDKLLENQPTQPEGYQGLNKWYVTTLKCVFYATELVRENMVLGYGYDGKKLWHKDKTAFCEKEELLRLATESEIIEAIKKGCEQKGIVEGARVKCLHSGTLKTILSLNTGLLNKNQLWLDVGSLRAMVFDNGTFADVVKNGKINCTCVNMAESMDCLKVCDRFKNKNKLTDKPLSEKEALMAACEFIDYAKRNTCVTSINNHNIDDVYSKVTEMYTNFSSDKELLKESRELFYIIKSETEDNITEVLIDEFLTKLNKHLNHE